MDLILRGIYNSKENSKGRLRFSFRISQVFGILPFTNKGEFSKALWLRSACIVTFLVITVLPAEIYTYYKKMQDERGIVEKLISTLYSAHKPMDFLMLILHVSTSYTSREKLEEVVSYAMKVRIEGYDLPAGFITVWILVADLNFLVFRPWAAKWSEILSYIRRISLFAAFFCYTFIVSLFAALVLCLEKRLIAARAAIKTDGAQAIFEHSRILALCQKINSCFGASLFIVIVSSTFCMIYTAYYSIALFLPTGEVQYYKIAEKSFYVVCLLYLIYYPVSRCEMVKRAAEAFNAELFKVMQDSDDLCKNDQLRLYVSWKPTTHFSACGFFGLEHSLVTLIITAATTYLVILVQFSMF